MGGRRQILGNNSHVSPAAIIGTIIGIMVCAVAPPLLPLFVIWVVYHQIKFRRGFKQAERRADAAYAEYLRQRRISAVRSLGRID